ncbi:outer membrane beta-barrel protein [Neotabrizicola shimadae]|uniref:Outer membrane beta-barrel protein n=1 Tax=Neotabrizicola shimadae TaxID=2807096 RepID=A0A8G0ZWN2_9RHOB|nr:outer membrane beta-barrel protein [Neotabrizicola shimadae]QYZ71568.1 outer membrane beta-barrel protein [Neotabrizicola shimadae]
MKLVTALLLGCLATPALAQDSGWDFRTTLYLWFPGMSATVDTPEGTVSSDLSPTDALSNLDMGFMGSVGAQNGNVILWGDLLYTDLGASEDTPHGMLWDQVRIEQKLTAVTGYALYDIAREPDVQFGLGAGFRYFNLSADTVLTGGSQPRVENSLSDSWWVPVLAAQFYKPIDDHWFVDGLIDWGMAGSDTETWQGYAGVGYRFNETWSTQIGYRYMNFSQTFEGRAIDTDLSGILAGVTISF